MFTYIHTSAESNEITTRKTFQFKAYYNMVNINSETFNLINTYLALTFKTYNTRCSKEVKTKE